MAPDASTGAAGQEGDGEHKPTGDRGRVPFTPLEIIGSLVALFTLGVGQPLLDLLGRNADFFVAHDAGRLHVIALGVGLTLAVPLLLAAVVLLVRAVTPRGGAGMHLAVVAALVAVLVLVVLTITGMGRRAPGPLWLAVAALAGVGAAAAYRRSAALRRALSLAAIAAPIVAGMFLFSSPVRGLVVDEEQVEATVSGGEGDLPPIVFVVFDELPLVSLLDKDAGLDTERFPALARLARDGSFFTSLTTVHPTTVDAVPATLSGRYSDPYALPTAEDHPTNMLALLDHDYGVRAVEPLTNLCPKAGCNPQTRRRPSRTSTNESLVRDVGIVGMHLVFPEDMADGLPPVDQSWGDFDALQAVAETPDPPARVGGVGRPERGERALTPREKRLAIRAGAPPPRRANHPLAFRRFIAGIKASRRPMLHFLHTIFPHRPWLYLPNGRRHGGGAEPALDDDGVWTQRPWPVAQGYQLHLVQTQAADRLIGELLDHLRRQRMYDDALIVVTADHGASFAPGTALRDLDRETFGEIGYVPLFINPPGQRRARTIDEPLQNIDILPTLIDILGVESSLDLDGRSALDRNAEPLRRRLVIDVDGSRHEFPLEPSARDEALRRKLALFDAGGAPGDFFYLAPDGTHSLLGEQVPANPGNAKGLSATLDSPEAYGDVDLQSASVPAHVSGSIDGADAEDPPIVAVAINGRIVAVTQADLGNDAAGGFRALVPPTALKRGANEVQLFLVGRGDDLTLIPSQ
ncbi:MAG: sulfatase-like hydrolase/transferase [Nitriliruptorales bacterium]|nr:sulfatase-like hydrolase/transferase [Nitriliruptorales bacterium]